MKMKLLTYFQIWFPGMETMRRLCFPENFHTRKSGEITVFFAVDAEAYSEPSERSKVESFSQKKKDRILVVNYFRK